MNSLDILDVLAGKAGCFLESLAFTVCEARNLSQAVYLVGTVSPAYQPSPWSDVQELTCIAHSHHFGAHILLALCSVAGGLSISSVRTIVVFLAYLGRIDLRYSGSDWMPLCMGSV